MTDQTIPADKVREILEEWERIKEYGEWDDVYALAQQLTALLPPPPRPTLADMTRVARYECKWMQADVEGRSMRYVIANPLENDGEVTLLDSDGGIDWVFPEYVTPRPDLPRLAWPGTEKPAPALPGDWRLADHYRIGRVIVTNPTPNPGGHVYFVTSDESVPRGSGWGFCTPGELTYLDTDQGADQ